MSYRCSLLETSSGSRLGAEKAPSAVVGAPPAPAGPFCLAPSPVPSVLTKVYRRRFGGDEEREN